jgi:hypothetical protein
MPGARCARSLACKMKKHTSVVTTVTSVSPDIPRAMVYDLLRALPGDQALLTPSLDGQESARLTPTSRRQDHTTSPSALAPFVKGAIRVHRIPPRVRDDRDTPLEEGRNGISYNPKIGCCQAKFRKS